jgi:UDP-N-acetylmuramoylalanine--D-glutamate ligase
LTKYYDKGKVYLAGNLQGEATLPLIKKVTKDDVVVLELSSWQLQGFGWKKISPYISVFTNIYEDHLNRYSNMKDYIADKKIIYKYQKKSDFCILGERNKHTKALGKEVKSQLIWFSDSDVPKKWKIKMLGKHNQANIAAAMNVGEIFGLSLAQMETVLANYPGLEHRLEFVRKVNNITFINDTTSTTPISGMKALEAIETPIVLLAGGATKQLEMRPFAEAIAKKVKFVILLEGSATDELERIIKAAGGSNLISGRYDDFEEAIKHAYGVCLPGDTLLLSPGCASFGMFINEFDRGERFKRIVSHLK